MPEFASTNIDSVQYFTAKPSIDIKNSSELYRVAALVREALARFSKDKTGARINPLEMFAPFLRWAMSESINSSSIILDPRSDSEVKSFVKIYQDLLIDLNDVLILGKQENMDKESKIFLAQVNQKLAVDFYKALSAEKESEQRQSAEFFVNFINAFCSADQSVAPKIRNLLRGARVQAGLMKSLRDMGCYVWIPENTSEDEIREWDVDGGVDFAVVTPTGNLYLMDAKARKFLKDDEGNTVKNEHAHFIIPDKVATRLHNKIKEELRIKIQDKLNRKKVTPRYLNAVNTWLDKPAEEFFYTHVVIPSGKDHIGVLGTLNEDLQHELAQVFTASTPLSVAA